MNEFVEECCREWQLLGVPDPIASEMAVDLTTDIEEAEAEGGSAEDVLGSSLFDPRGFAAAWASARGVTDQSVATAPSGALAASVPTSAPHAPAFLDRFSSRRWPLLAGSLAALAVLVAIVAVAGTAVVVGRHSSAVAAPVGRVFRVPSSSHLFGPGPVSPPARFFMPGPLSVVNHTGELPPWPSRSFLSVSSVWELRSWCGSCGLAAVPGAEINEGTHRVAEGIRFGERCAVS